jgi:hypothetical protein
MSTSDPVRSTYYDAVETANFVCELAFYIGAFLSLVLVYIEKAAQPKAYELALIAFAIVVVALFVVGLWSRLYLTPRAEDKRRQDFFSSALDVPLIPERTEGYYNNRSPDPIRRIALQTLENSLFTKAITLHMAWRERVKIAAYAALWVVCLMYRRTDLGVVVAASQALFSEQVLSKWCRLEWLRMKSESTHDTLYKLLQSTSPVTTFNAMTLDALASYEAAKANAGITLSSRIFERLNPILCDDWNKIRMALKA